MKKSILILTFLYFLSQTFSQLCVKTYNLSEHPEITSAHMNITVLEIAPNHDIWFNLYQSTSLSLGFGKFTGEEWTSFYAGTDLTKLHTAVYAIAIDKHDSVWVGTESGLAQFDGSSPTGWEIFKTPTLTSNKVTALKVDRNNIKWIGLGNGDIMTLENNIWTLYDSIGPENNRIPLQGQINEIDTAKDGSIWVAKNGTPGVVKYKEGNWTTFSQFKDARYITSDQYGRTFVTSGDSMMVIIGDQIVNTIRADTSLDATLFDVEVGPNGGVWVSSNKGLLVKVGDTFRRYNKSNSAIPDLFSPIPLEFDADGNLWFSYYYKISATNYPGIGYLYRSPNTATPITITNQPAPAFCYGDSIVLDANVAADTYVWSDGTTSQTTTIYDNAEVTLAYEGTNNCYFYDTLNVIAQHVFEDEKPCVVTVSADGQNLIVWEKTPEVGTASYNIYREVATDVYNFKANVPVGNLSVYRDQDADPRKKSYKYKISSVDTCGNESGQSFFHKTMHLTINLGLDTTEVNLIWQNYEGFYFPYYIIFRGTSPDNLVAIDSIPWDNTTLTYTDYGIIGRHYYRVGVILPFTCFPTEGKKADSGPYSHSMSNMEDNRLQDTGTSAVEPLTWEIRSYPNPFNYWTQIDFENSLKYPYELKVTDMSGKLVKMIGDIRDNKVVFLRDNLPQGFYMFELKGDRVYRGKFVIK
ncbi:MAG: hypothetical protein AMS27_15165 [Bacteroides sp. SM23_62_1]|nr:MAG: hypothetical protein AMS27_15165 [Bacteroides sp. SM23_62_1]